MSKLLITTQVYENYGAHDWDGQGECPQYWKAKGGSDYVVLNIDVNRAEDIALAATKQLTTSNEHYREYVLGWEVVADDLLTEYEQDQLGYEGEIRYPSQVLQIESVEA
jgi:hypothetical protein